jgi:hypothetical protein
MIRAIGVGVERARTRVRSVLVLVVVPTTTSAIGLATTVARLVETSVCPIRCRISRKIRFGLECLGGCGLVDGAQVRFDMSVIVSLGIGVRFFRGSLAIVSSQPGAVSSKGASSI